MIKVQGKHVTLYVYVGGVPTLAVCATNLSRRERLSDIINITSIDSGQENEYDEGGSTDSDVILDGVRTLDSSDWEVDEFEVGTKKRIIIIYQDNAGNSVSYDGNVLITGIDDSNPADGFSTYTVTMLRSGAWTKLYDVVVGDEHYLVDGNGDYILDSNGDYIIVP